MVAGGVKEGGGEFDFERFCALDEVDDGRVGDGKFAEQVGCGLGELSLGLDLVEFGLGVFDEGGSGSDFASVEAGGLFGEGGLGG